jgi:hypothetical protein
MELYCDPEVQFGGMKVGGIRISKMSHIDGEKSMALTGQGREEGLYKVRPLTDAPRQQQTEDHSGALDQLRAVARPGNLDTLQAKWQDIGADARKALAGELAGLKAACEQQAPPTDDVPFNEPETQGGGGYDGV